MKKIMLILAFLAMCIPLSAEDYTYPTGNDERITGGILGYTFDSSTGKGKWHPIAVDANGQLQTSGDVTIGDISVDTSKIEGYLNEGSSIHKNISSTATNTTDIKNYLYKPAITADPTAEPPVEGSEEVTLIDSVISGNKNTDDIKQLIKKDSEFPDDDSTPDVDESDTDSITKLLYDIKSNTAGGSEADSRVAMAVWAVDMSSATAANPATVTLTDALFKENTSGVDDLTHRAFIEFRSSDPEAEFMIGFVGTGASDPMRPVKGRILLECNNSVVYLKVTSGMTMYITEGWRE